MGLTGSGKSTLISLLTKQNVKIGHELEACTSQVGIYCTIKNGRTIYFVDTPGFDDTFRSDTEVLKDIAFFLSSVYKRKVKLAGMIYLHRITDIRMGGSALKNVHMFEALCGSDGLANTVLATTMWDVLEKQDSSLRTGHEREQKLLNNEKFWGFMAKRGSKVVRHDGTEESAWEMVSHILNLHEPVVLDIQRQMVDEEQSLEETPAGHVVQQDLLEAREQHEKELQELTRSMEYAISVKDAELVKQLEEEKRQNKAEQARLIEAQEELKTNWQKMFEEDRLRKNEQIQQLRQNLEKQREEFRENEMNFNRVQRSMRELELELLRKNSEHHRALEEVRNIQSTAADAAKAQQREAAQRQEALAHERNLVQFRLDEELKRQNELNLRMQEEAAELRKTSSLISLASVVGGIALTGYGAATGNPSVATAGVGLATRALSRE